MESYPWINKATVTVGLYLESKLIRSKRQAKRYFLWWLLITLQSNLQKLDKTKLETDFKLDVNEKIKSKSKQFPPIDFKHNAKQNDILTGSLHDLPLWDIPFISSIHEFISSAVSPCMSYELQGLFRITSITHSCTDCLKFLLQWCPWINF